MTVRVDKTEREFDEKCSVYGMPAGALKAVLDLEFREEEGLPEAIGYADLSPSRMLLLDDEGKPMGVVSVERRKMPVEDLCALLVRSFGRYNDYPKLEALARELGADLAAWLRSFGGRRTDSGGVQETEALLSRLRELTGEEG